MQPAPAPAPYRDAAPLVHREPVWHRLAFLALVAAGPITSVAGPWALWRWRCITSQTMVVAAFLVFFSYTCVGVYGSTPETSWVSKKRTDIAMAAWPLLTAAVFFVCFWGFALVEFVRKVTRGVTSLVRWVRCGDELPPLR
jgi:hypothetical protein